MMSKEQKQYYITEHIWRLGRWILGSIVIIVWFTINTLPAVLAAFALLGLYEQLHGVICRRIEKLLGYAQRHKDYE